MVSILSNNGSYFNKTALGHIMMVAFIYVVIDVLLLVLSSEDFVSKSFYSKFVVCIGYLVASKNDSPLEENKTSFESPFHFASYVFCVWLAISNFIIGDIPLSKIVGIFLVFGVFAGFSLLAEFLKLNKVSYAVKPTIILIFEGFLKVSLFVTLVSALLFLTLGEWKWFIKPFYEW